MREVVRWDNLCIRGYVMISDDVVWLDDVKNVCIELPSEYVCTLGRKFLNLYLIVVVHTFQQFGEFNNSGIHTFGCY
jgi:hypothetical protein